MPIVKVQGFEDVDAPEGWTLLEVCESNQIPMNAACGGFACCNSCRVDVLEGGDSLSQLQEEEEPFLEIPGQRLGCQAQLGGDVTIRLAPGM